MMQKISITAALLLFFIVAHAQIVLSIRGKITDANKNAVANATITQVGTNNGTTSNNKGIYNLEVEYEDSCVVEFNHVEFGKKTIVIYASNKATIYKDIQFTTNENVIDTVQITAIKSPIGTQVINSKSVEYFPIQRATLVLLLKRLQVLNPIMK